MRQGAPGLSGGVAGVAVTVGSGYAGCPRRDGHVARGSQVPAVRSGPGQVGGRQRCGPVRVSRRRRERGGRSDRAIRAARPARRVRLYCRRSCRPPLDGGRHGERLRGGLSSMAEHRIVAPKVTGSSPVGHPNSPQPSTGVSVAPACDARVALAPICPARPTPGTFVRSVAVRTGRRSRSPRREPSTAGVIPRRARRTDGTRMIDQQKRDIRGWTSSIAIAPRVASPVAVRGRLVAGQRGGRDRRRSVTTGRWTTTITVVGRSPSSGGPEGIERTCQDVTRPPDHEVGPLRPPDSGSPDRDRSLESKPGRPVLGASALAGRQLGDLCRRPARDRVAVADQQRLEAEGAELRRSSPWPPPRPR